MSDIRWSAVGTSWECQPNKTMTGLATPRASLSRERKPGRTVLPLWQSLRSHATLLYHIPLVKEITIVHPGLRRENVDHNSQ